MPPSINPDRERYDPGTAQASRLPSMFDWISESLVQAVVKLGVPAALAIILTVFMVKYIVGDLAYLKNEIQMHVIETGYYMRQICLNTAVTDMQRTQCLGLTRHRDSTNDRDSD